MPHERILIMAGGTGGHVYPALAVAELLRKRGADVLWLGSQGGLETRVVPEKGFSLSTIRVRGLRGKDTLSRLLAPFMLLGALAQTMRIIRRFRPDSVLGMGGYVSGPGGVAALVLRVPLYIHEQNAIAGLTNRLLSPFATVVMQAFPGTFNEDKRVRTTGNPVREEIARAAAGRDGQQENGHDQVCLLVLGGSQGARAINQAMPAILDELPGDVGLKVWHQTGAAHLEQTREGYRQRGRDGVRVDAYIDDMASAYDWADLVLCRAGAMTLAELCVSGLASILVPFPYAVDDHQTANARHLSDRGAAVLLPESELEGDSLAKLLNGFCSTRSRIREMAELARSLARVDATDEVAQACLGGAHA